MAITFSTNMLYTRAGEADPSDVLSAHNPLIWEFADGAIAATPTATVDIVVKNNAGATIYTSDTFDAYLLSFSAPTANFRFDATQIIKHIINNYFYKETSDVIEAENYGSEIEVTFKSYDNAVLEDTALVEYFASHALNQIGDEYGANIPRLFYNDTEEIAHFLGFPNHLFFYSADDLAAADGFVEILETTLSNIISGFTNLAYDTFTSAGVVISSAIELVAVGEAKSDTTIAIVQGEYFKVTISALVLNGGELPFVKLHGATGAASDLIQTQAGNNVIVLRADYTDPIADFRFRNTAVANWECGTVLVESLGNGMESDSLGLFMHDINLGLAKLSTTAYQVNLYLDFADLTLIKTWNLTIFQPCENAVYIRFLTKDGYYMYWAFSPFPSTNQSGQDIGNVINSFAEMALANSRHFPIGKKNAFKKLQVAASSVPIVFRRKLMDLFISPAVYVWQGNQTVDENILSSTFSNDYDTFTSDETVIILAINLAGGASFHSAIGEIQKNETIVVIFDLTLNSGQAPTVRITKDFVSTIMDSEVSSAGFNIIELKATATAEARIQFVNSAASNFSTGRIVVKRAEIETDWILLEGVEGSHDLREKKQADNFRATLVFPEKYTQQLAGQNI